MSLWTVPQDFRFAFRSLRRSPFFSLSVIGLLAAGCGLTITLVSLINSALYRPWQVAEPRSMVIVHPQRAAEEVLGSLSVAEYRFLREHTQSLGPMAAWLGGPSRASEPNGSPFPIRSAFVNADYFRSLRVRMSAGRDFHPDEENYSAPRPVAIISYRLWQQRYASDPAIVGRTVRVGAAELTVIGVAESGFEDVHRSILATHLWMPIPTQALVRTSQTGLQRLSDPRGEELRLLAGRLRGGYSREAAGAELDRLSRLFRAGASLPAGGIIVTDTRPARLAPSEAVSLLTSVHVPLLLGALLTLLIACTNAGHLLLARAISRQREVSIQLALGAGYARVFRHLLAEGVLLSAAGGAIALAIAFLAPKAIVASGFHFGPQGFSLSQSADLRASFYQPDGLVIAFAIVLTGLAALVSVAMPCAWAGRRSLALGLTTGFRSHGSSNRWRTSLLSAQLAMTVLLLSGASLLTRAVDQAASLTPGFAIQDVEVVSVDPQLPAGAPGTRRAAFFNALRAELRASGDSALGWSQLPPMSEQPWVMMARRPDDPSGNISRILMRPVSSGYFAALEVQVTKGTMPQDTDVDQVVVNESAARVLWPDRDPIGQPIESAVSPTEFVTFRVAAVVKDTPVRWMNEIEPVVYRAPDWDAPIPMFVLERGGDHLADRVKAIASGIEPTVKVDTRPMVDYVRETLTMARVASRAAWALGGLALLLAVGGLIGVFGEAVERRRQEIGVRMALGAQPKQIATLVYQAAGRPVALGLVAGAALSLALSPVLNRFLYGLDPLDPGAYLQVAMLLLASAALATWIPARRALRVDPAATLRGD